jgi:hypothetical protein
MTEDKIKREKIEACLYILQEEISRLKGKAKKGE